MSTSHALSWIAHTAGTGLTNCNSPRATDEELAKMDLMVNSKKMNDNLGKAMQTWWFEERGFLPEMIKSIDESGDAYRLMYMVGKTSHELTKLLELGNMHSNTACNIQPDLAMRGKIPAVDFPADPAVGDIVRIGEQTVEYLNWAVEKPHALLTQNDYAKLFRQPGNRAEVAYAIDDVWKTALGFYAGKIVDYPDSAPLVNEDFASMRVPVAKRIGIREIQIQRLGLVGGYPSDKMTIHIALSLVHQAKTSRRAIKLALI